MFQSPIWDPVTGFGGNGDLSRAEPLFDATWPCITNGPFKHMRPLYYFDLKKEHCLGRLWNNGSQGADNGVTYDYSNETITNIQALEEYSSYREQLELGPHNALHSFIGADMDSTTAPNGQCIQDINKRPAG
jgi:tyrosinase